MRNNIDIDDYSGDDYLDHKNRSDGNYGGFDAEPCQDIGMNDPDWAKRTRLTKPKKSLNVIRAKRLNQKQARKRARK